MNVSLTPRLEKWVQSKVSTGLYTSSSEVVREALRIMSDFEKARSHKIEALRDDILIGLDQASKGKVIPFTESELGKIIEEAKVETQ